MRVSFVPVEDIVDVSLTTWTTALLCGANWLVYVVDFPDLDDSLPSVSFSRLQLYS